MVLAFRNSLPSPASRDLQAGVESLEPQDNFWGVDLSDREHEAEPAQSTTGAALRVSPTVTLPRLRLWFEGVVCSLAVFALRDRQDR
jgi:hypothetical protein